LKNEKLKKLKKKMDLKLLRVVIYMTDAQNSRDSMIVAGTEFNPATDYTYTKLKIQPSGSKQIGITNPTTKRTLFIGTPLMLTWGVNEWSDESTGRKTYDMTLQFPREEYNNSDCATFLANMTAFEEKLKADALVNSKEWLGKAKTSPEVVDALWTPMLKYPKDQESGEPDHSRAPTLKVKLPIWEGEWKCELYNLKQEQIFPNDNGLFPPDLIAKATNVATVIQSGGLWFANGKFGVTWKLVQAVVKPKESLRGKCFIQLSAADKAAIGRSVSDEEDDDRSKNVAMDSSDEDDEDGGDGNVDANNSASDVVANELTKIKSSVNLESSAAEPTAPAKKKVVRKKKEASA